MTSDEAAQARARELDNRVRAGVGQRAADKANRNRVREIDKQMKTGNVEMEKIDAELASTQDKKKRLEIYAKRNELESNLAAMQQERDLRTGEDSSEGGLSVNDQVDAEGYASVDPDQFNDQPEFGRARIFSREEREARRRRRQQADEERATAAAEAAAAAAPSAAASSKYAPLRETSNFMGDDVQSVSAPASSMMSSQPIESNVTNNTTINVNGGDIDKVRKVVRQELDANNRSAAATVSRPAGA